MSFAFYWMVSRLTCDLPHDVPSTAGSDLVYRHSPCRSSQHKCSHCFGPSYKYSNQLHELSCFRKNKLETTHNIPLFVYFCFWNFAFSCYLIKIQRTSQGGPPVNRLHCSCNVMYFPGNVVGNCRLSLLDLCIKHEDLSILRKFWKLRIEHSEKRLNLNESSLV